MKEEFDGGEVAGRGRVPLCPRCGSPMAVRRGYDYFWGCSNYPDCKGKRNLTAGQRANLDRIRARREPWEGLEARRLGDIEPRGKA